MVNRKTLTKLWRKHCKYARLFWKASNPRWRDWDSNEIARARSENTTMHFYSLEAIRNEIELNIPAEGEPHA
jgi:hypothetical protein